MAAIDRNREAQLRVWCVVLRIIRAPEGQTPYSLGRHSLRLFAVTEGEALAAVHDALDTRGYVYEVDKCFPEGRIG